LLTEQKISQPIAEMYGSTGIDGYDPVGSILHDYLK